MKKNVVARMFLAVALFGTSHISYGLTVVGPAGGSGGDPVQARACTKGFITEIYGRGAANIDQIGMRCADQDLGTMGGGGGDPYSFKNPQGFSGIYMRAGEFVYMINPLDATGNGVGNAGGDKGESVALKCPRGEKIVGFGGRSGRFVDQLKLICAAPVETIPPCPEEEAKAHAAILQINKSLDDARKKIADLQQDLNRQTADAKDKSDKQIAAVNESFKAQLEKVKTETAQNLAQSEKDLDEKVKAAQQAYAAPLKKMQDDLQAALQKTQQTNVQSLTDKNQKNQQQIKAAIDKLQQLITTANGALNIIPQVKSVKDPRVQEVVSRLQQLTQGI